jgi:hypothetical protein
VTFQPLLNGETFALFNYDDDDDDDDEDQLRP